MTQAKKLKKVIRARARKTGERYTAARRQVLLGRAKRRRAPSGAAASVAEPVARPTAAPGPKSRAKGGFTDASVVKATGQGFEHWFAVLDAFDVRQKGHKAAAEHLYHAHNVPGWHSQMVTVAYERDRGLRATNQSCRGDFQVSVSKMVPASVAEVASAFDDPRRRAQWLRGAEAELARAVDAALEGPKARKMTIKKDDYARMRFPLDGGGTVQIYVYGKPKGASVVAHTDGLADAAAVDRHRQHWRTALESLKSHLA